MGGAVGLWVAAEWRRRWPALIGLAVLVALAGGAATALAAGARRADTAYTRFRDATGEPNLVAQVTLGEAKPTEDDIAAGRFDAHVEAIDELAALEGVESVEVESWWAIAMFPEEDRAGQVTAFATGTFATAGARATPIVVDGHLPGPDDPDAVTINEAAVRMLALDVGSTLTFQTASPERLLEWVSNDGQFASNEALDGPTVDVRVAAVVRSEGDLEAPLPSIELSEGFARAHGDEIAHVEAFVRVRADPQHLDAVTAGMEAVLGPYGLEMTATQTPGAAILPSVEVGVTTLWIAAAVTAAGGLLLVGQALGRLVAASATDRPALAAMGMTRPQQALGSIWMVIAGIAAGALAVPMVAWAASALFPRGAAALAEPDPGLRWDGPMLAAGAIVTFIAACAMAALIAAAVSRRRSLPATASGPLTTLLSGHPAISLGASFAADPAGAGRRSRAIAGAAAAGVAVAVAAVLVVTTIDASRRHLDASPSLYGAATDLVFESNGMFGLAEVVDGALATPGVTEVTRHLAINDDTLTAGGPSGRADVEPEAYDTHRGDALVPILDGRHPQDVDEVALGSDTATALGAGVGDEVTVEAPGDGTPVELTVTGVVSSWDPTDPGQAFIVQPEALRRLLCPDDTLDECNLSANVFASAGDAGGRAALLRAGFADVVAPANVARLGEVGSIPWLLVGFLCLFAAAGLAHAVLTSQRRRARDLAIVRALGLGPRRAGAALTWQAVLTTLAGTVAGLLLGALAGPVIWRAIADDLGVIVVTRLPVIAIVAVVAGALVVAAVLSVWPRWRAVHASPAVALRSE